MRRLVLAITILLLAASVASALDYEEKPDIAVSFYGSNYFERGDQKTLTLVVYNNATREKVEYDNMDEAGFFGQNEDMLFTAYDVKFTLEGNDYIEVKTSTQSVPALPPMQPTTLNFIVKISDDAKAGKYELNLKATFYRIDGLKTIEPYPGIKQVKYEIENETGNEKKVYIYQSMLKKYEIDYTKVTKTIPIAIYVEEKSVVLEVVSVQSEDLIGKGKGKITVEVKNVGDKVAKSAYLVLDTPSGITAQGLALQSQGLTAMPGMMLGMTSMPMGMPMGFPGMGGMQGAQMPSTTSSLSTTKAAYYVGDLKPGETATATFYLKLDVKDEGVYPLHIKAVYLDDYERLTESESTTFGIHVKAAPSFEVVDVKSSVFVNAKGDVTVKLRPSTDLKDASVILTAKQPLSVLSAEYYVGDVRAGEEFTAVFKVKASDEAKPITYPAEITVKYKTMDEYFESDPVT
ncbi:COG1361 S-layer family protein, partial [Archaeoglobus sp.]